MIRVCPLTQADLTKMTVAKLQTRLKATSTTSVRTLENALRNKFGVEPKSQGVLALSKEYAEIAVAQASDSAPRAPSPPASSRASSAKRASPASSRDAAGSYSKKPRRSAQSVTSQSVTSDASPFSDDVSARETSPEEEDSSFAGSSFAASPMPPPLRGTPVRNHAAALRNQHAAASTPQSRSSVNVNVASTGLRRVNSSGSRVYGTGLSSPASFDSPLSGGASRLPSSPAHPSRLDFSTKDGRPASAQPAGRSRVVSVWEVLIVVGGAVLAIGMTAFVDTGLGLQPYKAPAAPQIDTVPASVRSYGSNVLGALEWSCRSVRPVLDAKSVLAKLNMTGVTEREIGTVLSYHARKGTLTEHLPDGMFTTSSRYSFARPCGVTLLCRLYRFLWLALPLLAAVIDIVMRFKFLNNSRLFAGGILEELKHAAEMGRSLAAHRLREELVERLGITGTGSGITAAWRRAEAMAFKDKRLHKYAQVDGGEQIEMWQFKAGTARHGSFVSPSKPRAQTAGTVWDGLSLAPRAAVYALLVTGFYTIIVQ